MPLWSRRLMAPWGALEKIVASRSREAILSLCPALVWTHLQYCVHSWAPQFKKHRILLENVQQGATRMIGSWSISHMRTGWEAWSCSAWRRLIGDLINVYKYLMGGRQVDGAKFFLVVSSNRTRSSSHKQDHRKFKQTWERTTLFWELQVTNCPERLQTLPECFPVQPT